MIPKLVLDPRNEAALRDLALKRISAASKGTITDFSANSPITALIEGQVFAAAELLYYTNMLPEALALEVFRLSGADISEGTKARGTLTFLLERPLSTFFALPVGYIFTHNNLSFALTKALSIPPGSIEADTYCEAIAPGSKFNLPAYTINIRNTALSYLSAVTNKEEISGGSDRQSVKSFLVEAQAALRQRAVLVSVTDYGNRAKQLLGEGSNAIAFPALNSAKREELGNVHVFCLSSAGKAPSSATLESVRAQLQNEVMAGTYVWVSVPDQVPVHIHLVALVSELSTVTADALYAKLKTELGPAKFKIGTTVNIRDIEYWARQAGALDTPLCTLNGQAINVLMPQPWALPQLSSVTLDLTANGFSQTYSFGATGDPE
jgi:hypothetical protein